jgi:PAS domain S-box-containing protein
MYPAIPNFELFFEHAADLLFIATSDGRMKAANECFRKVTGYADESNPLEQLFVAPTWSSIMQSATSGPTAETPFQIRTAADVLIGVKGKVFVEEESGDLCGLFRSNSLVTVPDPLQNSEHQLRSILSAVPAALLVIDRKGQYRHVYAGLADLLVADRLVGRRLGDVMSEQEAQLGLDTIAQVLKNKQLVTVEYTLKVRGVERWFSGRVVPFGDDSDPCVLWVATDISELMAARMHLQKEHELLQQLLELGEKERQMIACEIHDGFVQHVVGAQMWMEAVKEAIPATDEAGLEAAKTVQQSMLAAVVDARQMISSLRPIVTETIDLEQGIANLAYEYRKQTAAEIELVTEGSLEALKPLMAGVALRIVQESVRNAVRHAGASKIVVLAKFDQHHLTLQIDDDGCGFDTAAVSDDRFGLQGIKKRAEVFAGLAEVKSQVGEGTRILVQLPLIDPRTN